MEDRREDQPVRTSGAPERACPLSLFTDLTGAFDQTLPFKDEKDKKSGKYIRRERYAGSMSRSFYVGEGVTQEDIHAKYEHGVLKLSIPKKEEQKKVEKSNYIAIE